MTKNLEEYFRQSFREKLLVTIPEHEDDHLCPATRLLEKRREMTEVELALKTQKDDFVIKSKSLQQRREEQEKKELNLKESMKKFDKFLKENDSKRLRAIKKANDEIEYRKVKMKEIEKLRKELHDAALLRGKLQERLNKYVMFYIFLAKVVENADEFHEITDIISRYDTLLATHQDLVDVALQNQDDIEDEKQQLKRIIEEKNNDILDCNNRLSELITQLDKAESAAAYWESKWNHIKTTAAKKTIELGRTKMAAHNLYQLVETKRHQEIRTEDTMKQLDIIKNFVLDIADVISDIRRAMEMRKGTASNVSRLARV